MTPESPKKKISVRLSPEVYSRLDTLSKQTERSLDFTARRLLEYTLLGPEKVEPSIEKGELTHAG